jgi:uncharacterized protein YeaO (DUF488 family)
VRHADAQPDRCSKIKLKRAYERPDLDDGTRILVDRRGARHQEG